MTSQELTYFLAFQAAFYANVQDPNSSSHPQRVPSQVEPPLSLSPAQNPSPSPPRPMPVTTPSLPPAPMTATPGEPFENSRHFGFFIAHEMHVQHFIYQREKGRRYSPSRKRKTHHCRLRHHLFTFCYQ